MIGTLLQNRYRLDAEIGRGGMGVVYRAHDTLLDRPVAVKVLSASGLGTDGRARLLREAQAVAKLDHPNIVSVYDAGEVDGTPFIVMQLVSGTSLRDVGPLSLSQVIDLGRQLCDALENAHEQGIVHRDIKPENIIVTLARSPSPILGEGPGVRAESRPGVRGESRPGVMAESGQGVRAKLMDFGLALSRSASRLTEEGALVGTVFYLSPEQALGLDVDGRADLYSLGVVLYELAAGRLPFTGDHPVAIITQHLHAAVVPPSQHNPAIPPSLEAVILKLLAKNRDERFASAREVADALAGRVESGRPVPSVTPRHNLPLQLTSFVGREREIAEVKRLLIPFPFALSQNGRGGHSPLPRSGGGANCRMAIRGEGAETRLVTLTGSGGCGKTRLAIQVAGELAAAYPDGAWLVELAPLPDAALVPQTVAAALGVREEAGRPVMSALEDHLRPKRLLLVLDNCEHLIEACARLVDALLRACPDLRVLASSRESLGLAGEMALRVPSLSLPPMDPRHGLPAGADLVSALSQYEAVQLFVERAGAALSGYALTADNAPAVSQVCNRLDGLPLAIELAAARVQVLRVEQIAARLDDRFRLLTGGSRAALPRQQTLRALIDWSYDLLSEAERALLRRLSVFAGGWTLEAAEAVCPRSVPSQLPERDARTASTTAGLDTLDLLTQLVNKSLVVAEREQGAETRFRLLETIRQFAREKLLESGGAEADQARDRHLEFFVRLAQARGTKLSSAEQAASLRRLEAEHDNLRTALEWSLDGGAHRADSGLRLAGMLFVFWHGRAALTEGRRWLERALQSQSGDEPARAQALVGNGVLAWQQGDYAVARAQAEAGVALWRKVGDRDGLAEALHMLGHIRFDQQDYPAARALFDESLDFCQALGGPTSRIALIGDLGLVACHLGDYETARARYEESLALFSQAGDKDGVGDISIRLGDLARLQGDYDGAEALYAESLEIKRELHVTLDTASALHKLGYVAQHRGDLARARELFAESLAIQCEAGNKQGIAECLFGLAGVSGESRQPERAARLFAAAEALLDSIGAPLAPADRAEVDRDLAALREQLDPAAFAAAWAEGRTMTREQALALASASG